MAPVLTKKMTKTNKKTLHAMVAWGNASAAEGRDIRNSSEDNGANAWTHDAAC